MDQEIAAGSVGSVGKYDVAFKEGKLIAEVDAEAGAGLLSAGLIVKIDAGKVVDAIEAAIPGKIDDAVLEILRAALIK